MERIAVAGLTLHGTDVTGLERARRAEHGREAAFLRELADELGASELVLLATCNRVEVVYAREEGDLPGAADLDVLARVLAVDGGGQGSGQGGRGGHDGLSPDARALRGLLLQRTGREAARHLFRVAASLDSLVVGEDQILAQVRDGYGAASDIGLVGPLLGPLFHHALAVGKQVRSDTELARHPISLVNLAVHTLLERDDADTLKVAVIGAGRMGSLLARALTAAALPPAVIANRSVEGGRSLAIDCGAQAVDLGAFRRGEVPVDALVAATSAPGLVLGEQDLLRLARRTPSGRPLLAVDLAVPRDLAAPDDPGVRVVDLDALRALADQNRALRAEAAAVAERIVEHKVDVWCGRHTERAASDAVGELQQVAGELLDKELRGLLDGRLAHLTQADRRAVERWARATFGRLMHLPVAALKRLARDMHDDDDPDADAEGGAAGGPIPDLVGAPRRTIRLGTRGSDLALWQARHVAERLAPEADVELVVLQTRGDRIDDVPLTGVEGKAFFTAEIEQALLEGRVDLAVHSHKDLPTESPPGLSVVAVPLRGPFAERLLVRAGAHVEGAPFLPLAHGARVGTSSPRRMEQLSVLRPDLAILPLRGNVPTRVRKLREGSYDAVLLAAAGLDRLALDVSDLHVATLPPGLLVPAPAQGALALQVRADDQLLAALLRRRLHDAATAEAITAERALLARAGGGCNLPLGALVRERAPAGPERFHAAAFLGAGHPEAGHAARWAEATGRSAAAAVERAYERLVRSGPSGAGPLGGRQVVLVGGGETDAGSRLAERLVQLGAGVAHAIVLERQDLPDAAPAAGSGVLALPARLVSLRAGDALAVTSRHAAARLSGAALPAGVLVGAVGPSTARALLAAGLRADVVGTGGGRELAEALAPRLARGARVLFPCAEAARPDLAEALSAHGITVEAVPVYRTVTAAAVTCDVADTGTGADQADALVYLSPSAVQASLALGYRAEAAEALARVAIGGATAAALEAAGLPHVRPEGSGVEAALGAVWCALAGPGGIGMMDR
jgi:hydroxymethylbilane synthase/glutamyl-tRNA reductase